MERIEDITTLTYVKNRVEKDPTWLKFLKKYDFFKLSDGKVLELSGARTVKINRDIYEPDTDASGNYRSPKDIAPNRETLRKLFIANNMDDLAFVTKLAKVCNRKIYLSMNHDDIYCVVLRDLLEPDRFGDIERELTPEEYEALEKYEQEQEAIMLKRLESYWKRYGEKVNIRTYWEDR